MLCYLKKKIDNNQLDDEKYIFINQINKNEENKSLLFRHIIFVIIILIFSIFLLIRNYRDSENLLKLKAKIKENEIKFFRTKLNNNNAIYLNNEFDYKHYHTILKKEKDMPHLGIITPKRTFDNRYPLPKEIKCKPHFRKEELLGFLSLLSKNTIYYEIGSGCSSVIAKYYAKKTYAVEGCKGFYKLGLKNGLKDVILFKDLKPDNPTWSFPGKNTNLNDWKQYFQANKSEYNADVILIDGRFKITTAMDIFNKIKNDTIVVLHEYNTRPQYFVIENYYKYIYHWGSLYAFVKNTEKKDIPMEIQKKYWNDFS